jgi:tetratricopeptide (TPR) repeat protein
MRLAERALELSRGAGTPQQVAACAQLLGECRYVTGDVDGARALAEEALRLDEAAGDPAALAADLNLLGVVELTVGRPQEGLPLVRRSYDLRAAALGPDDEETIESLNNVGVALWRAGSQDEAIATHEDALQRCERSLGDHRRTAETLNALAVKLQALGSSARARELYERALVVAEAALGPDSELVGRLLANVATARIDDGDTDGTAPMIARSLELHERHFGPVSRWTAHVLGTQGSLAWLEGRHADARDAFERALVINVNELGPRDADTLDAAMGLINALSAMGPEEWQEATAIYLPVMALLPAQDMGGLPRSALPDLEQAEARLRQVAARAAERVKPDAAQAMALARADALAEEADVAFLAGDVRTAADRLEEAIGLLQAARGATHPALVEPLHRLKLVMRVGGTESRVLPILERVVAILDDAYGSTHPLTIRARGEVYWQERREYGPAGGQETARRIERDARSVLGEAHPATQVISAVLAAAREAIPPGTGPDAEALSVRRERILAQPSPLADELLGDLEATPWASLSHGYGPAIDTPRHIRLLLAGDARAGDERVRDDALELLGESLLAERSAYPATAPAMRLVRRLAGDARVSGRPRLIRLLGVAHAIATESSGEPADELRAALGDVPGLLRHLASVDGDPAVIEAATEVAAELATEPRT